MSELFFALVGGFVTLIPERYRKRFFPNVSVDATRGALLSGLGQFLACLGLFIFRYLMFIQWRPGTIAEIAKRRGAEEALGNEMVQFGIGITTTFEYLIQPLTLMILYFLFEGLVRGIAAFISGEVIASLPLQAIAWAHDGLDRRAKEAAMGPLVNDVANPVDIPAGGICIESCRPKAWTKLTTISHDERLFELDTFAEQGLPRRFVYVLRPSPPQKVVRGLHHYRVDEVFDKPSLVSADAPRI